MVLATNILCFSNLIIIHKILEKQILDTIKNQLKSN